MLKTGLEVLFKQYNYHSEDLIGEFYTDEVVESEQVQSNSKIKVHAKTNQGEVLVQEIMQDLQRSMRAVN